MPTPLWGQSVSLVSVPAQVMLLRRMGLAVVSFTENDCGAVENRGRGRLRTSYCMLILGLYMLYLVNNFLRSSIEHVVEWGNEWEWSGQAVKAVFRSISSHQNESKYGGIIKYLWLGNWVNTHEVLHICFYELFNLYIFNHYAQIKKQPPPGSPTNGVKQLWIACAWDHYQSVSTEMWWMLLTSGPPTLCIIISSHFHSQVLFLFYMMQSYLQLQAQAVYKQLQHQLCPSCHYRLYPTVLRCRLPLYLPAHPLLQSVWCLCHYRMGLKGTHIEMLVIWYEHCYHLSYLEHICSVPNSSGWLQKLLASNWHVRSLLLLQQLGELWKRTTQVKYK